MKGNIYKTKWGWQVRFGEKICRHYPANNLIGAERYLNFLRHQEDEGIFVTFHNNWGFFPLTNQVLIKGAT